MAENWKDYDLVIFDFDGVLVDSNVAKLNSFCQAASEFSTIKEVEFEKCAQSGSRFQILRCMLDIIKQRSGFSVELGDLENSYEEKLESKILKMKKCELLGKMKRVFPNSEWAIVSASEHKWLNRTVSKVFPEDYFDRVLGAPSSKSMHFSNLNVRSRKTMSIGDTFADYEVSSNHTSDFFLVDEWSLDPRLDDIPEEVRRFPTLDDLIEFFSK